MLQGITRKDILHHRAGSGPGKKTGSISFGSTTRYAGTNVIRIADLDGSGTFLCDSDIFSA
jgi:hypothetical protein